MRQIQITRAHLHVFKNLQNLSVVLHMLIPTSCASNSPIEIVADWLTETCLPTVNVSVNQSVSVPVGNGVRGN